MKEGRRKKEGGKGKGTKEEGKEEWKVMKEGR